MMAPRQISVHAERELARWQDIARGWPLEQDGRLIRCGRDGQGIVPVADPDGRAYALLTDRERLALVVAHLRMCHPEAILG